MENSDLDVSRVSNVKKNILGGFINRLVSVLFPFVMRTVLIYQMGELYLGLNGLFCSILQVISLAELGLGEAIIFSLYEPLANGNDKEVCSLLNMYKKTYIVIGAIITVIGIALIPFLSVLIKGDIPLDINMYIIYIIYLANAVLGYFLFAYKNSLLIACQRLDITSYISTICNVIMYTAQIVIILFCGNYYMYCMLIPITTIINNIFVALYTNRKYPHYYCEGILESEKKNDIKKRVIGVFIYKICGILRSSVDSIVISMFLGLSLLARFQNYYYIMNSVIGFMLIIVSSLTASVGNSIVTNDVEKNYKDFQNIQFIYMSIVCVCTTCLVCLFQPFIEAWLGKTMVLTNNEMLLFCVYFFTSSMGNICYVYRQAAGLWWQDKVRPIIETVVNLVLNILLVQMIGIGGVLLSTIICLMFINCIWGSKILFKYYFVGKNNLIYVIKIGGYALITIIACLISLWISACILPVGNIYLILLFRLFLAVFISVLSIVTLGKVYPEYRGACKYFAKFLIKRDN